MRLMVLILICCFPLIGTAIVAAQEQDLRSVPLEKGERAPFAGQLITPDLAANLGSKAELCKTKAELELDYQTKLREMGSMFGKAVCDNKLETMAFKMKLLSKELEAERSRTFWGDPMIVAPIAAFSGVAFAFGAVLAAAQLR